MSKDVVSGVGVRYASAFVLSPVTGLPDVGFNSGTLVAGTVIQGIDTFDYNSPEPQLITHYGDDNPFAQDSLPPTEVGSFTVTTAKTNLALDAFVSDTRVVTIDTVVEAIAGNTNKRGSEPQTFFYVYRQALDTQNGSATFGKLRQWHQALVPSTRIVTNLQSMQQTKTTKTYNGIPTPVATTPWNQTFTNTTWGATKAEYIEMTTTYKPEWAVGFGNGTLTRFKLPRTPISVTYTHAFVNGTLATVSSVSTSDDSMILSAAPGGAGSGGPGPNGEAFVAVLVEHQQAS